MQGRVLALVCCLALVDFSAAAEPASFKDLRIVGEVAAREGALEVLGKSANVVLDAPESPFRATFVLTLAKKGLPILVGVMPQQPGDLSKPGVARISLARDADGATLTAAGQEFDVSKKT